MTKSLTYEIEQAWDSYLRELDDWPERYECFEAGWCASKADSHNHKAVMEYDLAPAMVEGKLRDKLIEMGWTPPGYVRSPVTGAIGVRPKRLDNERPQATDFTDSEWEEFER